MIPTEKGEADDENGKKRFNCINPFNSKIACSQANISEKREKNNKLIFLSSLEVE